MQEDCESVNLQCVQIIRPSVIHKNKDVARYYRFIFNECDTNGDGLISVSELKEFLARKEGEIPDQVIKCMHDCFDKDHNDQLDFDEFLSLINHPRVKETFQRIGSSYLKFVVPKGTRSLTLRRTVTNTGRYEEEITFNWYCIGMIAMSLVQVICFYIDTRGEEDTHIIKDYIRFVPWQMEEVWRFVSYIFVHEHEPHLYGNIVFQLLLGLPLELVHTWRVMVIYIAGAIGGAIAQAVFSHTSALIGASAGLYSFYTAHISTVLMNWREMSHPIVHLIIFAMLVTFDAISNYVMHIDDEYDTSYISHLGGVAVGLPLGIILLRNLRVTKRERILWYASLAVFCVCGVGFLIAAIVLNTENRYT